MGLLRNMKITNHAYKITYEGMRVMSRMRSEDPSFGPSGEQAIENIGDELAVLARDFSTNERERSCILKGLRQGLKAYGLSDTATENICAILRSRIMAGQPASTLGDDLMEIYQHAGSTSNADTKAAAVTQSLLFARASVAVVADEILESVPIRTGYFLYVVGAVDYLSQHYRLDNEDFRDAAVEVLSHLGLPRPSAEDLLNDLGELIQHQLPKEALMTGGQALANWMSGKDPNAPLALSELIRKWPAEEAGHA